MISFLHKQFPDFSLLDQAGTSRSRDEFKGKKALIYFYPKDSTPGCTLEAQGFQELEKEYKKAGVVVIGVSPDKSSSHQKFCDKYNLAFPLLADTEKKLIEACGVWVKKKFMGREYMGVERVSYLLNEKGMVIKEYAKVKPVLHPKEVLADLDNL